jgi:26S proteasome regulatory subunit T1
LEEDVKTISKRVNEACGIKESDTGLANPSQWDLIADRQIMQEEQPLQVARCTKIINAGKEDAKYIINVKQIAKFVVGLGERVSPTDIEEGMRVGYINALSTHTNTITFSNKNKIDKLTVCVCDN